jgi:hypothetical protein
MPDPTGGGLRRIAAIRPSHDHAPGPRRLITTIADHRGLPDAG